jgi:hypothetical protein
MFYHGAQGTAFCMTVLDARCGVDMLDSSLASLGGEVYSLERPRKPHVIWNNITPTITFYHSLVDSFRY